MDLEHTPNQSDIVDPFTPKTSDPNSPTKEPLPPSYTTEDDIPNEDSICHECRQVDWDSLPNLAGSLARNDRSRAIRTIEADHEPLATSSCKICRILSDTEAESLEKTECIVKARPLLYFNAYALSYTWASSREITALHVCPRDRIDSGLDSRNSKCLLAIRRDGEDFISKTISPRSIDYDWLKRLARSCEESHRNCRWHNWRGRVSVSGLKVIEVSSRTVIEAPAECRYVALSYVWGKQPDVDLALHLQRPPPLIEDAISVTVAMDYKYLWIDRYCIGQTDDQERYDMINRMDQVYANASLTIIDASGKDAQSGLPGVSVFPSRLQKCVRIRNTAILELPCGTHELISSKWATRGWTYQEGYFSLRRLIFTPSQVLFLCNTTYEEEAVYRLLQQNTPKDTQSTSRFWHLIPTLRTEGRTHRLLMAQLQEYSKRDLTYDRDSLKAFLGVLNFHAQDKRHRDSTILHVSWGLIARKWLETGDLSVYLDWYHKAPAERRPDFPSWAWTGWGGPLEFKHEGITLHKHRNDSRPRPDLEWEMCWESKDGNALTTFAFDNDSWNTSYTDERQLHQQSTKRLKVTCLVVPISFQVAPLTGAQRKTEIHFENEADTVWVQRVDLPGENMAVVQFCQGIYIAAPTYLDQDLDVGDDVIGLLFANEDDYSDTNFGCLLARQLEEGTYERVGAIPDLMAYPLYRSRHYNTCLPGLIFLDEAGSILDKVRVTERHMELPFDGVGERGTIVLV